jgi:hypothetical protein
MSVANELSCEVAVAILAHGKDPGNSENLLKALKAFRSTLMQLSLEARQRRRTRSFCVLPSSLASRSASSNNH